jgi:hypothetical protein
MKEIHADRWRQTRERGFRAWVIQHGILAWGLPMCGIFIGMQGFRRPDNLFHIVLVNVPLWLTAGGFFGITTWYAMEWQYKRYVAKGGRPHVGSAP